MLRALLLILFQLEFQPLPFFFVFLAEVETFLNQILWSFLKESQELLQRLVKLQTVFNLTQCLFLER
jgi:hypothetical protein